MSSQLRNRWSGNSTKSEIFLKSEITTKMRLGDFWASNGEFYKCRDLNKEALDEYEKLIIPDVALRTQLNDQYFAVEHIKPTTDLPKKKVARQRPALGIVVTKTPACKTTVTVFEDHKETSRITELMKNMAVTPFPKHSRRLLLFKNDDDNLKPPASARTARIQNKKEETPPDIVMQTPSSLRTSFRKILQGKAASSAVAVEKDDDVFTTPKPAASKRITRVKNKKQETSSNIVVQTPSSLRTSSRKTADNKVSSSIAFENDDDSFATPGNPPVSSRITKITNQRQENVSPCKIIPTPTSRAGSKRIIEGANPSRTVFKRDDDLVAYASTSKAALSIRSSRVRNRIEESARLDIVKQIPSSSGRTRASKRAEENNVTSLRIRKN